jgi:hypothetical protein
VRFQRDGREFSGAIKRLPCDSIVMDAIGRPTKRDPAKTAIISKALALGMSNKDAAKAAGIALSTLDEWMKIEEFAIQIESAVALRKMNRLERIENAEPGWQALCWLTERSSIFDGDIRWISPDLQIRCRLFEASDGAAAGSEAALVKGLSDYHALKNGQRKATEEAPREV